MRKISEDARLRKKREEPIEEEQRSRKQNLEHERNMRWIEKKAKLFFKKECLQRIRDRAMDGGNSVGFKVETIYYCRSLGYASIAHIELFESCIKRLLGEAGFNAELSSTYDSFYGHATWHIYIKW